MMQQHVGMAFLLTLLAGLSTGIGGLLAVFSKKTSTSFLTFALGLSAGVMVYISFAEMMPEAGHLLAGAYGERAAGLVRLLAFFGGMLLIALIDRFVPESDNPHEAKNWQPQTAQQKTLHRAGVLTAIAVAVHNFPEGMATFVSALREPQLAMPIVAAIAIHNIPEGIAVAAPIYYATGKKGKAFMMSLLSGVAEPLGAMLAFALLMPYLSDALYGILYAVVSGIMVFISFDELLPGAEQYRKHHVAIMGVMSGMAVMALSLVLLMN